MQTSMSLNQKQEMGQEWNFWHKAILSCQIMFDRKYGFINALMRCSFFQKISFLASFQIFIHPKLR